MQLSETALSVIKRNGEVIAFNSEKIKNVIETRVNEYLPAGLLQGNKTG